MWLWIGIGYVVGVLFLLRFFNVIHQKNEEIDIMMADELKIHRDKEVRIRPAA